jgi:flagellar assembly factor FliW
MADHVQSPHLCMPNCNTRFHGVIDFEPEQVLEVPSGLFGFPEEREFLLLEIPSRRPMVFVQSTRTADLCFITLPVQVIDQNYRLVLSGPEAYIMQWRGQASELQMGKDLLCLALLTIGDNRPVTANLLAPLVIDITHHKATQILVSGTYSHQHPISAPALSAPC